MNWKTDGEIMSQYGLTRCRSSDILDSTSLFAFPLSKTYSVPNVNDFSEAYNQHHGLRTIRPIPYTTYRSYFPYKTYQPSYLNTLYWNDKPTSYSNTYNRQLQPRHYTDYTGNAHFMNHSFTLYPNRYTYNDLWYNYKMPSYYRNFYYVSPYYDYYTKNAYNYRYNYRHVTDPM